MNLVLKRTLCLCLVLIVVSSCVSIKKQIDVTGARSNLSQVAKKRIPTNPDANKNGNGSNITIVKKDSVTTYITDVEIGEDGEQISKINIEEIIVTSTLKSIPERFGFISIDFVVTVPKELQNEQWCIKLTPVLNQKDTVIRLDPVVLRGAALDLLQHRQQWQQGKYSKTVEYAVQKLNDTTETSLWRYNDRNQFFKDKAQRYNMALYDNRVDFFNSLSTNNMELYRLRAEYFNNSDADRQGYHSFFGKEASDKVYARQERTKARREAQSLTPEQAKYIYGTPKRTIQNRQERLAAVEKRSKDFIAYPRDNEARMDSLIRTPNDISYFYSQDIKTDEHTSRMTLVLKGNVEDFRGRKSALPASDTLTYTVASMINFIDYEPRYVYKIIEKYATVNDRNWITFPVGRSKLVDTLADNKVEIEKMTKLMNSLLYQYEFFVDSIVLTAASSPEGNVKLNNKLSKDRAHSLRNYLVQTFNQDIDTILKVRWIGEDWSTLASLISRDKKIVNRSEILDIIATTKEADRRDALIGRSYPADFKVIKEELYPQLRSVSFKYALRRVGMIQDTVYTTELDSTYLRGVQMLEKRNYKEALGILEPYKDINTAITLMSLGYDKHALEIMETTPQTPNRDYMLAVLSSRTGNTAKGVSYFESACKAEPWFEYRANLDPEMQSVLKARKKVQE